MKPGFQILLLACMIAPVARGQSTNWAVQLTGTSYYYTAYQTACDGVGNVYVIGDFEGTLDLDPGPGVTALSSAGGVDAYLAKYDPSGNLLWGRSWGGTAGICCPDSPVQFAVDGDDNVVVVGHYSGTVDFDPGPGTRNLIAPVDVWNGFVVKFSPTGSFLWAGSFFSSEYSRAKMVDIGLGNSIVIEGDFRADIDLNPGVGTAVAHDPAKDDQFVVKLDADGNYQWGITYGGPDESFGIGLLAHSSGDVYVSGNFQGDVDFNPTGTPALLSTILTDGYLLHLDSAGNFVEVVSLKGTDDCNMREMVELNTGNIALLGNFNGLLDLDPGPGYLPVSSTNWNGFLLRLTPDLDLISGQALTEGSGILYPFDIAKAVSGDLFVCGMMEGSLDMDVGPGVHTLTSAGDFDAVILALTPFSTFSWVHAYGNSDYQAIYGITTDASGSLYAAGDFSDDLDLQPGPGSLTLSNPFGSDGFLMKIVDAVAVMPPQPDGELSVYPNPSSGMVKVIIPANATQVRVQVMDAQGRILHEQTGSASDLTLKLPDAIGIYLVCAEWDGQVLCNKVVRQ